MKNQIENRNLQTLISDLTKSRISLKKMTQFLVSVSVFSLLLSNHSFFGPSFLHYFDYFYLSRLPLRLFTHTLDKNCIFLLCNGLLVFVAKYSGLISSSPNYSTSTDDQSFRNYELDHVTTSESKMPLLLEDEYLVNLVEINADQDVVHETIAVVEEDKENECMKNNIGQTEDRELIIEELIVEEEEEDVDEGDKESGFLIIGKEGDHESELSVQGHEGIEYSLNQKFRTTTLEEEEEDYYDDGKGNGVLMSTQELNKKFEEFIRKMKEEIKIEAQQHLVISYG